MNPLDLAEIWGIRVIYEPPPVGQIGYASQDTVWVDPRLPRSMQDVVLLHEIAHLRSRTTTHGPRFARMLVRVGALVGWSPTITRPLTASWWPISPGRWTALIIEVELLIRAWSS